MKDFRLKPALFLLPLLVAAPATHAQTPDAQRFDVQSPAVEGLFEQHCAFCHTGAADSRAPTLETLAQLSPEAIIRALTDGGAMRTQGYLLSGEQRRALAEHITGRSLRGDDPTALAGRCESPRPLSDPFAAPGWNGWGPDHRNTHFQPEWAADLTVEEIPQLKLQWAFGFQDASSAWSQPTVVGNRVYVGSQAGAVYALDAGSGCSLWAFAADSGVRTSVSVVPLGTGYAAVFGDMSGNLYAVNADSGELLWKQEIESHPLARITGSPVVHESIIYVPMSSFEESQGALPEYGCCTFRGSVSAVALETGEVQWKTWLVDAPQARGSKPNGVKLYGPAGGAVWSAPTVDVKRERLYVAVGNAYAEPQPATTDAVVAMNMHTGSIEWVRQTTPEDIYVTGCRRGDNCPRDQETGPDVDFGTSPVLGTTPQGRELIYVGQKSGMAYAMDPDAEGAIVWEYRAGLGGALGGIQWGLAVDDTRVYVPVADPNHPQPGGLHALALDSGERHWFAPPPPLLCGDAGRGCNAAISAAITVIPGAVFAGSIDGGFRAWSVADGTLLWEFDTNRTFQTVNGVSASGGSLMGPGPTVVDGRVFVNSGYGALGGRDGNVLLMFAPE